MTWKFVGIIKEYSPQGHGKSLFDITEEGKKFLNKFCSPTTEGLTTWDTLKRFMEGRAELIAFKAWGIFGELFADKLKLEYEKGRVLGS